MKTRLEKEMETLLISLYAKAIMTQEGIFEDPFALETIDRMDYDFCRLRIQKTTQIMLSIRAELMDEFTREFLKNNSEAVVLHLGCGLDSRYLRLGRPHALWYELDFPEVISIKEKLYPREEGYSYIHSSVTDHSWLQYVSWSDEPVLVIAEGLLMYLTEKEIKELLGALKNNFGSFTMIFDTCSKLTRKYSKYHPSIKKTGAQLKWGIDNPKDIENFDMGVKYIRTIYMTKSSAIRRLSKYYRMIFILADKIKPAREALRIIVLKID